MSDASPVPDDVQTELTRVVRRWQQLPLDHAHSSLPLVRALLAELAPLGEHGGIRVGGVVEGVVEGVVTEVPDLGPAVVMDQLRVLVHDACAAGRGADLARRLATLRRSLP